MTDDAETQSKAWDPNGLVIKLVNLFSLAGYLIINVHSRPRLLKYPPKDNRKISVVLVKIIIAKAYRLQKEIVWIRTDFLLPTLFFLLRYHFLLIPSLVLET